MRQLHVAILLSVLAPVANGQCDMVTVGARDTTGRTQAVTIVGETAYIADGEPGLRIFDVSDPGDPDELSVHPTADFAADVVVVGGLAYVADWVAGFRIINISDPAHPYDVGSSDTPHDALGIAVVETHVYVADGNSGLRIFDASDPEHPTPCGSLDTPGYATRVAVSGNVAYVADRSGGLQLIDVSDCQDPRLCGVVSSGDARDVTIDVTQTPRVAYIADFVDGLMVIDVEDCQQPILLGRCSEVGAALGLHVGQGRQKGLVYVAGNASRLHSVDVSDPAYPVLLDSEPTSDRAFDVSVVGNIACVAAFEIGIRVIDLWDCPICRVDLDDSHVVDTRDVLLFLGLWVIKDLVADWDGNGAIDSRDFFAFLNDWVAGC